MERGVDVVMTTTGGFTIAPGGVEAGSGGIDLFSLIITALIFRQTTGRPCANLTTAMR